MKNLILLLLLVALMVLVAGCGNENAPQDRQAQDQEKLSAEELVKRGEYLVSFAGCHDCHSPKDIGPQGFTIIKETMLSGYPSEKQIVRGDPELIKQGWILFLPDLTSASGPWGVSFSANLTPDQSGIGNWTQENFIRALKEGKYKGLPNSRTLLPPMPWQNFANAEDNDLIALFSYLKSIPPVSNVVPAAIIEDQSGNQAGTTAQ